jgi:hypothetical protein
MNSGSASFNLSWPPGVGEVVLQQSADLMSWTIVNPQPASNSAAISMVATKQFFRLCRP